MKLKKSEIPQKNLDKNDDFVYSTPLFCCSFFYQTALVVSMGMGR
jgi:hypothetical protein